MAWGDVTNHGTANRGSGNTLSTPNFTPAANTLMVAWIAHKNNVLTDTCTGHGVTWTQINEAGLGNAGLSVWVADSGGSPSNDAVDFGYDYAQGAICGAVSVDAADLSTSAIAAIVENDIDTEYIMSSPPYTLGGGLSLAGTGDMTMIVSAAYVPVADGFDQEAGYTEEHEVATNMGGALAYIASADTTPTYDTDTQDCNTVSIAFGIAQEAGGGSTLLPGFKNTNIFRHMIGR